MVEAAGQWFRIFRCGLDYAFIPTGYPVGMRGVLYAAVPSLERTSLRILVPARSLPNQRAYESLQGREGWPSSTPRRCHAVPGRSLVPGRRQGSPNEPRYHSALAGRGDHCVNRTRVRKYSANRFYMRSLSLI